MFNFTTVVFDGTSPTFYFTNTSGWNTSSSNYCYYLCYHLHVRYLNDVPETNPDSRAYSVAAVLYWRFVLHVMLFRLCNKFCTFLLALSAVCVQCPIWLFFFISLISCFPGMLLGYCLSDFKMVPVAPVITGITFVSTFHMLWISVTRSSCFKIFSASFLSQFYLQELKQLLTCTFLVYYHGLWCPVY